MDNLIRILGITMMVSLFTAIFSLTSLRTVLRENGINHGYFESSYIFRRKKFMAICSKLASTDIQKNICRLRKVYLISFAVSMAVVATSLALVFYI